MLRLAEFILKNYSGKVIEVGIGNYTKLAEFLAENGLRVVATDVVERNVKVDFFVDDIQKPNLKIYEGAELIYSLRPPPEIFNAIISVARKVGADCIIKPLYGDYPNGKLINHRGLSFYMWRCEDD